jgi:hypothetical protein
MSRYIHNSELHLEISRSESGKIPSYRNERKPEKYLAGTRGPHRQKSARFSLTKSCFTSRFDLLVFTVQCNRLADVKRVK